MNDRDLDELLNGARSSPCPNPEMLEQIAGSLAGSMRPVRRLPPRWMLTGAATLICAAVAAAGATALGFGGIIKMGVLERVAVFPALAILMLLSASELASAMTPGSRRRFSSIALLAGSSLCMAAVLALCFRDYQTTHFIRAGLVCLAIGLLHAVLAAVLSWLILRRGFAVDPISAGLAAGTLAGVTGGGMLELHCANFQAAHVLVWHVGVLLVSGALGALCGKLSSSGLSQRGK